MTVTPSELLGLGGAALSGYAYLPQITHLVKERCAAGLSERAFLLWLVASLLMTVHALSIRALVFVVLGLLRIASTAIIRLLRPPLPRTVMPFARHRAVGRPPGAGQGDHLAPGLTT